MLKVKMSRRVVQWLAWLYLLVVLAIWICVSTSGDSWWLATIILFGPRWVISLPLIVLLPLAAWCSRQSLIPLVIVSLVIFGPFMGINIPIGKVKAHGGQIIRVITCNIDNGKCDVNALATLIREEGADIVALQEFPPDVKLNLPPGWQVIQEQKLAILSRFPIQRGMTVQVFDPPDPWPGTYLLHCVVNAPQGNLNFCSIQLPTPRSGLMKVLDRHTIVSPSNKGKLLKETVFRTRASQEVKKTVASLFGQTIIAGDFNMPVDSVIYKQTWSEYSNAFSKAGMGYGWTQRARLKKLTTIPIRIDHILTSNYLDVRICEVAPDVGSDHLPLVADIELKPMVVR